MGKKAAGVKTRTRHRADSNGSATPEAGSADLDQLRAAVAKLAGEQAERGSETFAREFELAAEAVAQATGPGLGQCSLAADALAFAVARRHVRREELGELLGVVESEGPASVEELVFTLAVRSPRILGLPPVIAVEAELRLLFLFAPISAASFWSWGPDDPAFPVASVGDRPVTRASETAAREAMFDRQPSDTRRNFIHGLPVLCREAVHGALVIRARPAAAPQALRQALEVARALEVVLDRDLLLERTALGGRSIIEAGERRLRRVGLDLHDGPLQEFARFYGDLQMLRHRLVAAGIEPELIPIARDLDALLSLASDVQASLRETSRSLGLPRHIHESLETAFSHEAQALELTGIRCQLRLTGDPQTLTQSQRIALVRILQEAFANIRLHSRAGTVNVEIAIDDGGARLEVVDDGQGFDVERVLRRAPRRGRLGLIGMRERTRLLGGSFSVRSRPEGPTVIAVELPAWRPLRGAEAAQPEG